MSTILNKDKDISLQLKGLAILAVIGLHLLTFVPPQAVFTYPTNLLFISVNQALRFCVPIFIFLSGFGLSLKYLNQKIKLLKFYQSRLTKILPLYLIWSAYYLFLSEYIDPWWKVLETGPVWKILLLGWADYHLYFVSVILQLYLLFPFIHKLSLSKLKLTLMASLIAQLGLYSYFSFSQNPPSDQIQNTIFLTWIFYFILGIYLARVKSFISKKISLLLLIIGLILSIIDTHQYLQFSKNIVLAIRFAKIPQLLYSFGFISFFLNSQIKSLNNKIISWFGKHSYLIYLSHPVLVHLANFDLSEVPLTPVFISFAALLLISIIINKNTLKRVLLFARKL